MPCGGNVARKKDTSEVGAGEVGGIECAGTVCVAEANDEKVAGVGCVVGGGAVVADNEAWRFEGCPNRWSVGA